MTTCVKTERGRVSLLEQENALSEALKTMLMRVDGKTTDQMLCSGQKSRASAALLLLELEAMGMIKRVEQQNLV